MGVRYLTVALISAIFFLASYEAEHLFFKVGHFYFHICQAIDSSQLLFFYRIFLCFFFFLVIYGSTLYMLTTNPCRPSKLVIVLLSLMGSHNEPKKLNFNEMEFSYTFLYGLCFWTFFQFFSLFFFNLYYAFGLLLKKKFPTQVVKVLFSIIFLKVS